MRGIVHFFVAFQVRRNVSQQYGMLSASPTSVFHPSLGSSSYVPSPTSSSSSNNRSPSKLDEKIRNLFRATTEIGSVGSLASNKDREKIQELADAMIPYSVPQPAFHPLQGEFRLVYSGSSGASSGRLFGTALSGHVKQVILDDERFCNHVKMGPLEMTMLARREIQNETDLKITLLEGTVSLFGIRLGKKQMKANSGTWNCKFVGKTMCADGKERLVRILQTPNLFILEQVLD